ncbi:Alpha-amylase A type-1 2 [Pyrenophora seminiperda CCB06]|uniref:alpha-amylase n=1 Tax=Pyrenophora seminiperda CCB06 TaxID=1302712 RepID=A0A3M7MBK6_9PLEO|nr:Alpha-amylase A type-1 2 [Pyrenophora seminiperda CCB06]
MFAADTTAWKSRSIYFVLTDRVARSSSDVGGSACSNLGDYCGGTFKGLQSKLDYIQGLGFDSIWITPVVSNKAAGYHGYWAEDLYAINSKHGTAADLKALTSAAHARGIFDGVRIDTVKHVEKDYWPGFSAAAGVYSIGEVFDGDPNYLAQYAKLMPGLLNYAVYYPMNNFYQQTGSSQALVDMMNTVSNTFPDPSALGTFLDNHDNKRWLNVKNDKTLLANCLAYVILARGIPIVYYGTEQNYGGGDDPANREDLWRSNFNTNTDMYQNIKKLTAARKAAGGLGGNDHVHLYVAATAYAWSRAGGNLIVLTTNSGSSSNAQHCFNTQQYNGKWTDVYGSQGTVTADGSGNICVNVKNGQPVVLLASYMASPTTGTTLMTRTATATGESTATGCPSTVSVSFSQNVVTVPGDTIKVTGNTAQLGNWNPAKGLALSAASYTSSNPVWTITIPFAAGSTVQYKFVKVNSGGATTWENDPNRSYTAPTCQSRDSVGTKFQ